MHRFFVAPGSLDHELVPLAEEVLHHLGRVLRLRPGQEILLLDGSGQCCRCRLETLGTRTGTARVLERRQEAETAFSVRLLQALPKGDKFDLVLQKGTELGVTSFVPLLSARSIPGLPAAREEKRLVRWRRIIREAARQSRRFRLPTLLPLQGLEEALAGCREELRLMLWETGQRPLREVLTGSPPASAAILVGPEGGFPAAEAEAAVRAGFQPVGIGPRILRTETAGFAMAAILQYLYGDMGTTGPAPGGGPANGGEEP